MAARNQCALAHHLISLCVFMLSSSLCAFDQPYFYRATYFLGEPRFEKEVLTSFDLVFSGGTANHARDAWGNKKICLLNIYGLHNMHNLGMNVPASTNEHVNTALENLAAVKVSNTDALFAHLSFKGTFNLLESIINVYQNLIHGFFYQVTIPLKSMTIDQIYSCDMSPLSSAETAHNETPAWTTFLQQFDAILTAYNLTFSQRIASSGLGDIGVYLGWTRNYQETEYLDFIDFTFKAGILFPTAPTKDEDLLFDIPLGNNGHSGFPLFGAVSIGLYEWITTGFYVEGLFFHNQGTRYRRMKTAEGQSGMITLYKGRAKEHKGSLWDFTFFAKADHMPGPFSLLVGYSYTHKRCDYLIPQQDRRIQERIINTDPQLKGWTMHTVHIECEIDFTQNDRVFGPRLTALINIPVRGKNIIDTTIFGGDIGIDCSWNF